MADEVVIFDATASNIDGTDPGSPLTVGPGTSYPLIEWDFPAAPLNVQYASSVDTEGEMAVSSRYGNRTITMKFEMVDSAGTLLAALRAKYAKLQREGGTLKRTMTNGDVRIYDIVAADGWSPVYDLKYYLGDLVEVSVTLPARPLSRGAEVDLGDNVTTTLPWLVFTDTPIAGDAPALGRLVVDNDEAGTSMRHLAWGVQSRYYSSASTAALFYEAESCALFGGTTSVAGPSDSSATNVARNTSIGTSATQMIYLGASSTAQTHIGSYRVFARVQAPTANTGTVSVGIQWIPYTTGTAVVNTVVPLTAGGVSVENQWVVVDLGMVSIPKARKGTQGWIGYLTAQSTVGTDDLDVDWIALLPVDESSGETYNLTGSALPLASAGATSGNVVEVRYDGALKGDPAAYLVEPDVFEGDYLLIPPSGAEVRTLRVICRYSRHIPLNVNRSLSSVLADVVGDLSARLFVTPRFLT